MEFPVGRPPKYKTKEELEEKIAEYFSRCGRVPVTYKDEETGETKGLTDKQGNPIYDIVPPTNAGLALFLGYAGRDAVWQLKQNKKFSVTIKKALTLIEDFHEKNLSLRDKCTGDIWWFKINGIGEKTEQEEKPDNKLTIVIDWGKDEPESK